MLKRGEIRTVNLYVITFIALFLFIILVFGSLSYTRVYLSPVDNTRTGAIADGGGVVEMASSQGGIAGGAITECDYIVEPQEGETFEPYPVYHLTGPGSYVIGSDLIIEGSALQQYSQYLKGCLTALTEGDYFVDGQGHTVTIDNICPGPVCVGVHSAGAAFYLKGGEKINIEIDDIHTSNFLNSLVKAEPNYFDDSFNYHYYGLNDNLVTIKNSNLESEFLVDMGQTGANLYVENSDVTSTSLQYCQIDGNCEGFPANTKSTVEFHDTNFNDFIDSVGQYVAPAQIQARGSEYGSYDLTIESLSQNMDLTSLKQTDVSNYDQYVDSHLGHLSVVCKGSCNSLADSEDSSYSIPISMSLEMNEGEAWFGKEPSGAPQGSAGGELKHPSAAYVYFLNLEGKIEMSHNFISIKDELGDAEVFNRTAVLILRNHPAGSMTGLKILRNGIECTDCTAFTPLDANDVIFSVTRAGNYSIGGQAPIAYDISQSQTLSGGIVWSNALPGTNNVAANGNNGAGATNYYLTITAQGTNVDVYMKANSNLVLNGLYSIPIANEKYASSSNPNVPGTSVPITLSYVDNKIGNNLGDGSKIYLKFYLDTPAGQQAGDYSNLISFVAVPAGSAAPSD